MKKTVAGSYTIEAALIVPLILAILFALIQSVLYLHDTVWMQVWLYEQGEAYSREQEEIREPEADGRQENGAASQSLSLSVLQCEKLQATKHSGVVRLEAQVQVRVLPSFITAFLTGFSEPVTAGVTAKQIHGPSFVRLVGAIIEEEEGK